MLALVIVVGDASVAVGLLATATVAIYNPVRLLDKLDHPIAKLASVACPSRDLVVDKPGYAMRACRNTVWRNIVNRALARGSSYAR